MEAIAFCLKKRKKQPANVFTPARFKPNDSGRLTPFRRSLRVFFKANRFQILQNRKSALLINVNISVHFNRLCADGLGPAIGFTLHLSSLMAAFPLRKKARLHVPAHRKGLLFFCKHKINSSNSKLAFFQKNTMVCPVAGLLFSANKQAGRQ